MDHNFQNYPICDTDIWVNLCLGDLLPRFFRVNEKMVFADVVEGENLAWKKENQYSYIANEFEHHKTEGNIIVIRHDIDVEPEDRVVLETILQDLGFRYDFRNQPPEKNKGEFVSAIYADHFRLPYMKTNDSAFGPGGDGSREFPDLRIMNWYQLFESLVTDPREKIQLRKKIEEDSKRMNDHFNKYKKEREAIKMDEMLSKLATKFNKR